MSVVDEIIASGKRKPRSRKTKQKPYKPLIRRLWISCPKATGEVRTRTGRIIDAPPIWKAFLGQPLGNLTFWLKRNFPPVALRKLKSGAKDND